MTTRKPVAPLPSETVVKKLTPRAEPPVLATMRRLGEADALVLERLLAEQMECVYHPSFKLASAEARYARPLHADEVRGIGVTDDLDDDDVDRKRRRALPRGFSREQEELLFSRFNYARYRVMRCVNQWRGRRLTLSAAREILHWNQLASDARDRIVQANLGLVPTMIERSRTNNVDFAELISEGQLALLRSVSKFDWTRGFKFSTYACRAILSSISRSVALAVRHRNQFPTEFDPDLQKSDELERRRETVVGDFVEQLNSILAANLADLSSAEKRVLLERFGFDGETRRKAALKPKTLRQVAALFGVTKERVRQIQNKALTKLREALEERVFAA